MAAKAPGEGAQLQRSMGPQGERDSQVPKMLSWEEVRTAHAEEKRAGVEEILQSYFSLI